ncbi:hypothetical protein ATE92_1670 [Ulvibacter sp. MAR_2010_11]|uniref:hypothetical protein n=1 Tax=Ulvibacter sp. MAR_2010_11 TaxID=1250229 RepID=UPI000C2C94EC|nr:hypothetical protein [Ulvibacter sp. MAR_2010_11]PKA83515.1 hypothetical protein ATE92_1670 [Ulvibacter sp. MAR_2010_11]
MKTVSFIIIALLFLSCASETEQKSMDTVAELYGAKTSYSKGISTAVGQETIKKFTIKVSDSKMLDTIAPAASSGNIALMVYEGLTPKEKETYSGIDVELVHTTKDTAAFYYPKAVLQNVSKKSANFKIFSESILDNKYDRLETIKNVNDILDPIRNLVKIVIDQLELKLGDLESYKPFGIAEERDDIGSMYQYQGYFIFEKGAIPYIINIDVSEGKDEIIGYRIYN